MSKEEIALKLTELWLSNKTEKNYTEYTILKQYNYFLNNL